MCPVFDRTKFFVVCVPLEYLVFDGAVLLCMKCDFDIFCCEYSVVVVMYNFCADPEYDVDGSYWVCFLFCLVCVFVYSQDLIAKNRAPASKWARAVSLGCCADLMIHR